MPRSPLAEDTAAHQVAVFLGFTLTRRAGVEVYDEKKLAENGWTIVKPVPDYQRIARALEAGEIVEGARWRSVEYILRPAGGVQ